MRHSTPRTNWPRAEDLAFEPELAPLALLDAALATVTQSLLARNPELLLDEHTLCQVPLAIAARRIILLYGDMHDALDTYRALLPSERCPPGANRFPF